MPPTRYLCLDEADRMVDLGFEEEVKTDCKPGTNPVKKVLFIGYDGCRTDAMLAANPDQVGQFRAGKHKVIGFLVGQVMKASGGKVDPKQVNALMRARLEG